MPAHRVRGHCVYTHWKQSSLASVVLLDQRADILTTQRKKWTKSQMEQTPQRLLSHKNLEYNKLSNTSSPWQFTNCWRKRNSSAGRNEAAAPSQTFSPTYLPTVSFDLVVQIADFLTSAEVCMPPAHVHSAPGLGPDHMPQIPAVWVYLGSKACQQRTHKQSSSCCVKLLVEPVILSHAELSVSVDLRSGMLRGVT